MIIVYGKAIINVVVDWLRVHVSFFSVFYITLLTCKLFTCI